jgi:hypothetical protein
MPGSICNLIGLQYFATMEIKTTGLAFAKQLSIPIVIENVPVQSSNDLEYEVCVTSQDDALNEKNCDDTSELLGSNLKTYKPIYPFYKRKSQFEILC